MSVRYGDQFRFPQYSGSDKPAAGKSACKREQSFQLVSRVDRTPNLHTQRIDRFRLYRISLSFASRYEQMGNEFGPFLKSWNQALDNLIDSPDPPQGPW